MPIKPENRGRYPANWASEVRPRIQARAGDACEFCKVPNGAVGFRNHDGAFIPLPPEVTIGTVIKGVYRNKKIVKVFRIVCTTAHLEDERPENCEDDNLAFLCQYCHICYDAKRRKPGSKSNGEQQCPTNPQSPTSSTP